jgi:hypothetical protein
MRSFRRLLVKADKKLYQISNHLFISTQTEGRHERQVDCAATLKQLQTQDLRSDKLAPFTKPAATLKEGCQDRTRRSFARAQKGVLRAACGEESGLWEGC